MKSHPAGVVSSDGAVFPLLINPLTKVKVVPSSHQLFRTEPIHHMHILSSALFYSTRVRLLPRFHARRFLLSERFLFFSQLSSPPYLLISLRSQQLPLIFLQKLNTPAACFIISSSPWQWVCAPGLASAAGMCELKKYIYNKKYIRVCVRAQLFAHCAQSLLSILYTDSNNASVMSRGASHMTEHSCSGIQWEACCPSR